MSRNFNGTTQYLSNTNAILAATPLTMACWFYSTNAAALQNLMEIGTDGTANHRFSLDANGSAAGDPIRAGANTAAGLAVASTSTGYAINTWQHACGVWASTTDRKAYLNGGGEGTNTTSRVPAGMNSTYIGARHNAAVDTFIVGFIAEAAIWNAALNTSEIAALARGVSPLRIRPDNLKFYSPLFGVGSPEPDYIGGFHLTLNNAPTQTDHAPVMPPFAYAQGWQGAFTAAAATDAGPLIGGRLLQGGKLIGGRLVR